MKIFLKLDPQTIKDPIRSDILSRASSLTEAAHDVFVFEFTLQELMHAQALLTQHIEFYGNDLSTYLPSAITHFNRTGPDCEITFNMGGADFKKRMSEDMGVAISSLFMNQAFGIKWQTILQIPPNKKLTYSKTRPDFQGTDPSGKMYLFEAKGTTSLTKVEGAIAKGIEQVKGYPLQADGKYVIASYFSGDATTFPSTAFVIDPPSKLDPITDPVIASGLHYVRVLEFMGLRAQAEAYREVVVAKNDKESYYNPKYTPAKRELDRVWETMPDLSYEEHKQGVYAMRKELVSIDGTQSFEITYGVHKGVLQGLGEGVFEMGSTLGLETYSEENVSFFDDGTLLCIKEIVRG
jgi:hypothetical protein